MNQEERRKTLRDFVRYEPSAVPAAYSVVMCVTKLWRVVHALAQEEVENEDGVRVDVNKCQLDLIAKWMSAPVNQCEQDARDAARYRYLLPMLKTHFSILFKNVSDDEIDAAIDAARDHADEETKR